MKYPKAGLYIAALMSLFILFAPCLVQAQEPNPVPWPCRAMDMTGRSQPYPCDSQSETDVLVAQSFDSLIGNAAGFDSDAGMTAAPGNTNANLPPVLDVRREAFALTENRWARAILQPVAVHIV